MSFQSVIFSELNSHCTLSLGAKLNGYGKHEIIHHLERFFNAQNDGGSLQKEFEDTLPAIDLRPILQKHSKLLSAMRKAVPNSRFGSTRDNYCYNRCRGAIVEAKKAILEDGNKLVAANQWSSCLDYLVASIKNAEQFMVWNDAGNNKERDDLRKGLNKMYGTVEQSLGFGIGEEEQGKLEKLRVYFAEKS